MTDSNTTAGPDREMLAIAEERYPAPFDSVYSEEESEANYEANAQQSAFCEGARWATEKKPAIAAELYRAFESFGAQSDLLSIVGSYGDTLPDHDILEMLKEWNADPRLADTVKHETGLSPRELVEERDRLREALERINAHWSEPILIRKIARSALARDDGAAGEKCRAVEWMQADGWTGELPEWVPAKIELPPLTERGVAGQIMDAAWPTFGGNNMPAEFWYAFGAGMEFTLRSTVTSEPSAPSKRAEAVAWHNGPPPKPWGNEWFIAETTYGDRVVLTALPEEYTYDFKTADETYIKADKIKRWMQFPDSEFAHPRTVDAEAMTKIKALVELYFAPWGAAKAARWEGMAGDIEFTPTNAMHAIAQLMAVER